MKKPKPNPLLDTVVLVKERANLVAGLLSEREPEAFEGFTADFTPIVDGGGKVWFLPILDHRTRMGIGYAFSPSPDVRTALQAWERAKASLPIISTAIKTTPVFRLPLEISDDSTAGSQRKSAGAASLSV